MKITLTPAQQNFIQTKISTGKYQSTQQVIEIALRLLEEYERAESEWSLSVREKIQAAVAASEQVPPIDGESFTPKLKLAAQPHQINKLAGKVKAFKNINSVAWQQQIRNEWDETRLPN